jgi:hypothetical protein
MSITTVRLAFLMVLLAGCCSLPAYAEEPVAVKRILALKTYLAESRAVLSDYTWLETTVISMKGEDEEYRSQKHCSYGADGTVRRVPLTGVPEQYTFGIFFAKELKSDDVAGYIQEAVRLMQQYLPLNPNGIQAVTETGKLSFGVTDPGKQGRLNIRDFLYRGDSIDLDIDVTNNHPIMLKIRSFLATKGDSVTITVTFGSLYGSASFAREAVLEVNGKKLKIAVQSSDFVKITGR